MDLERLSPLLVLTNHMTVGGAEVYVLTVSKWFAERGVKTIVAASPGDLAERFHPDVLWHPTPLTDVRASLPLAVHRVRKLVRRYRPKAVIANSLVTAWVARLALTPRFVRGHVPVVQVGHGWPEDSYARVAPLARFADHVVPVSDEVATRLRAAGLADSRMTVVQNGVDLSPYADPDADRRVAARLLFQAGPDDLVITNIGRYTDQKAQHHIVDVAARLKDSHPHLRFGVIGYGPREDELRAAIERAGVGDRVTLLIKRSDVPDLLLASDIYFNCSDWEGMPLSTIEAMGAGLPLVCTEVEGVGALVRPDNGLLAQVGDPASMASAIARLADDVALRTSMGAASAKLAQDRFSQDRMCRDLADVVSSLL